MSRKVGIPWMKLDAKSYSTRNEHHGNNKAIMCEALEERWSSDPDLDRGLTPYNVYGGYRSGLELLNDINHEIEDLSVFLREQGKRGIRKDAITSFALIIKPDSEIMENLTREQQMKFFRDAFNIVSEKFGYNQQQNKKNIRAFSIHFDEGNPHMHLFGVPYTHDGRLSAKEIFTPKLSRWFNEEFPKLMNERGWNLEPCRDEESYQPEVAKNLNQQELKAYKTKCIEHKKNKRKQHGRSSEEYKIQQEIEKATKQEKQSLLQRESAVHNAENVVVLSQNEIAKREQALEHKEAVLAKYEEIGIDYASRAKNLFNSLSRESEEFQTHKARLYGQSLQRIDALGVALDESLLSQRSKQKDRQMSL